MNESQAKQIADLLNKQNQLTKLYDATSVLKRKDNIIFHTADDGTVTRAVEICRTAN